MTAAVIPSREALLSCPFCNVQNAAFSCAKEKDGRRHIEMRLECQCGVTISETLPWLLYSKMAVSHIESDLRSKLTKRWNARLAAKPADEDPVEPEELEKLIADRSANRAADIILANYNVTRRSTPAELDDKSYLAFWGTSEP